MILTRRQLLTLGAATAGVTLIRPEAASAHPTLSTTLPFPRARLANTRDLKEGQPLKASYPDKASPIMVVKFGRPVVGGVGPGRDVAAFSRLCTHMGCTLKQFDPKTGALLCACHYSIFDLTKGGMIVMGQATDNLPQVELDYDEKSGDIYAVGVSGLIFGRQGNVIGGLEGR